MARLFLGLSVFCRVDAELEKLLISVVSIQDLGTYMVGRIWVRFGSWGKMNRLGEATSRCDPSEPIIIMISHIMIIQIYHIVSITDPQKLSYGLIS